MCPVNTGVFRSLDALFKCKKILQFVFIYGMT